MSTEELRKPVEALGKVLAFAGSENQADWQTILAALRDQEAVLQECETRIRELCACYGHPLPQATLDRITAHLGGEQ